MAERGQIYQCEGGLMVQVIRSGQGEPACCGKPMTRLTENTVDAAREKHVPVVETGDGTVTVKVGSVAHPMEDKHFIEWIEIVADGRSHRQFLKPGEAPQATFAVDAKQVTAREFCNLHGLWKG